MSYSAITAKILVQLQTAYPRAVSYSDLYRNALPITTHTSQIDKNGGTRLRTLIKNGQVKRVVEGYYVWIPS